MTETLTITNPFDAAPLRSMGGFRRGAVEAIPVKRRLNAWIQPGTGRVTFRPPWANTAVETEAGVPDVPFNPMQAMSLVPVWAPGGESYDYNANPTGRRPCFLLYNEGLGYCISGEMTFGTFLNRGPIHTNAATTLLAEPAGSLVMVDFNLNRPVHAGAGAAWVGVAGSGAVVFMRHVDTYTNAAWTPSSAGAEVSQVPGYAGAGTFRDLAFIQGRLVVLSSVAGAWTLTPSSAGGVTFVVPTAPNPFSFSRGAGSFGDPSQDARAMIPYRDKYLIVATGETLTVFDVDNDRLAAGGTLFALSTGQGVVGVGTESWAGLLQVNKDVWVLGRHGLATVGAAIFRDEAVPSVLSPEDNQVCRDFYIRAISAAVQLGGTMHSCWVAAWQTAFFFCPGLGQTLVVQIDEGRRLCVSLWEGWTPLAVVWGTRTVNLTPGFTETLRASSYTLVGYGSTGVDGVGEIRCLDRVTNGVSGLLPLFFEQAGDTEDGYLGRMETGTAVLSEANRILPRRFTWGIHNAGEDGALELTTVRVGVSLGGGQTVIESTVQLRESMLPGQGALREGEDPAWYTQLPARAVSGNGVGSGTAISCFIEAADARYQRPVVEYVAVDYVQGGRVYDKGGR